RSVRVRPSGSVTETKSSPGSPVSNGQPTIVTLSPGFRIVDFQPARAKTPGAVISAFHTLTSPLSLGASNSIHECGLAHLNGLTVPVTVTVFVRSYPAIEWCAKAKLAKPRQTKIALRKNLMIA